MSTKGRIGMRGLAWSAVLFLSLAACKGSDGDDDEATAGASSGSGGSAGQANDDRAGSGGAGDEGSSGAAGSSNAGSEADIDGGADENPPDGDGAVGDPDAGNDDSDAAIDPDGGIGIGSGTCCGEHDTPGCSNADLQVCVCELLPSCCTEAWTTACVLIVEQKYCQPGVRDCVCGMEDGQWGQTSCCEVEWTDVFCDGVAVDKCAATPGCS